MWANQRGAARCAAIESSLRAAGRMVVCVDAAAEDSTARMSSLSNGEARTRLPVALRTSSELAVRKPGPCTACAAMATIRYTSNQHDGGDDRGPSRRAPGILGLFVDGHRGVPAPVQEHCDHQTVGERARVLQVEGVGPRER